MQKKSKLSRKQQRLAIEWFPLVKMIAGFFLQNRPRWQHGIYRDDLEGEGYLALTKAARTYDPARLPYPKAYFARAILNSMYKQIKRATRRPAEWKISLEEAADLLPVIESPDHLRLVIEDLGEDAELATDRFRSGHTLRQISEDHGVSLRVASVRSRDLARRIADALDIRLPPPRRGTARPDVDTSRPHPPGSKASGFPAGTRPDRPQSKTDRRRGGRR
jgi:DNA-directed RNA polymerase specialized sigma24 family protein